MRTASERVDIVSAASVEFVANFHIFDDAEILPEAELSNLLAKYFDSDWDNRTYGERTEWMSGQLAAFDKTLERTDDGYIVEVTEPKPLTISFSCFGAVLTYWDRLRRMHEGRDEQRDTQEDLS